MAWDAVKLTPPRAWRDQAWGHWLPPVLACRTTPERPRRGYSKGPTATLFAVGVQELAVHLCKSSMGLAICAGPVGELNCMGGRRPCTANGAQCGGGLGSGSLRRSQVRATIPSVDGALHLGDRGKWLKGVGNPWSVIRRNLTPVE